MTILVISPPFHEVQTVPTLVIEQDAKPKFGTKTVKHMTAGMIMGFLTPKDVIDHLNRLDVPNEMRDEKWR